MTFSRTNLGHLDLNLLTALVALVEERSTVTAARRLRLAQSTVSGTLGRLREILGDELLVRSGRKLEPTPLALELVEISKPHLEALAAAVGATLAFNPCEDAREFRIGCTDAVALAMLPALTDMLRTEARNCNLIVRVGDYRTLPGMLASGEISTALGYLRDGLPATVKVRVVRNAPWVVLRDRSQPPIGGIDDFCARPQALVTPMGDLSGFVDDQLARLGRSRRVAVGVSNFALLLAALPGSDLISTVPDFIAGHLARLGALAIDPCPVAVPVVTNTLAWRGVADRDPAERWFRERVVSAFANVTPV
ncbi:LysR family transcriptional regulator [Rhizobium laguerreae]|uniref:LysR family transcriptional regulator n=1 Tax=Rhizobium laguerreae TaxID=1076926 RepID=UPI001C90A0B1|nr:LysR family transcriptional regulator [Rhizobium laguerreae]MBY3217750.1 LysR family transcriptional regulator [Rhizobium laguerreae]